MEASSLALKVYLILGFELAVLYGCMFFVVRQCKKAFYANTTFLGISFAEAVNQNRQTDIAIVQSNGTTHFFFFLILFAMLSLWAARCRYCVLELFYPNCIYDPKCNWLWLCYWLYYYGHG